MTKLTPITDKLIKIILSVLLFLCLWEMPYGYYELVRFLALVGFGYLAIQNYNEKKEVLTFIYVALAILFQPIFKISLGRELWNIVDVIVGSVLIVSLFIKPKDA